jgi:galactokinase/mevalonate kinase-like predicted kinase
VEGKDINELKVRALAKAADDCWQAIMSKDLVAFAQAYQASFEAQVAMFPGMIQGCVPSYIEKYEKLVMAYKMPGAGGGGYLACVVSDADRFVVEHPEGIRLTIRRSGM